MALYVLLLAALLAVQHRTSDAACTTDDIRIAGSNPNQGRLEICKSNSWYGVCGYSWSCYDAKVACRQLGFTGPLRYYSHCCNYFGSSSLRDNRRWYCSSSDSLTRLADCNYAIFSSCVTSSWYYYGTAGIRCYNLVPSGGTACSPDGSVRLQDGSNQYEGRLEVCTGGRWSSVCSVDAHDASVVCKQLGHSQFATTLTSGFGSSQTVVTSLTCNGNYTHLNQCTINGYSVCTTSSSVSLPSCSRAIRCTPSPATPCTEGSTRLVDGDIEQEGRVEVCFGGVWGSICRYGWGSGDGYVACKSVGYDPGVAPVNLYNPFGAGSGPIVYSYVACNGFESSLTQCSKSVYPSVTCSSTYLAAVRCYDGCTDGDIQLTGGLTDSEGTVEICRGSLWGLVTEVGWTDSDAKVVCRQLGLGTQDAIAVNNSNYARPRKSMHYSHMSCTGAEDRLTQCGKTSLSLTLGKTTYKNIPAAAVSCHGYTTTPPPCVPPSPPPSVSVCTNGSVRLMGGQTNAEGRLEYCYNGQWSAFCTLRSQEATVACRQLGYTQYSAAAIFTDERFGSGTNFSLFQNITCSGSASETSLQNCQMNPPSDCLPFCQGIGIRCYTSGTCNEGAIRLVDGFIQQEGRVEVCMNGVWGSVCDQSWDKTDAHIICKQLSYAETEPVAYHNSYFGDGNGPIMYSNVSCVGHESNFAMCSKNNYLAFSCSRGQTAGVLCGDQCDDGEIRLVGGTTNSEGTVEICFGNLWGLITESGWTDNDASVVCKQLGFLGEGAMGLRGSQFGKPNKAIQASDVICTGDEEVLTDCTMTTYELEIGKMMSNNVDVAGVSCQMYRSCIKPSDSSNACTNDSIRLSGGSVSNEGRLEYCYQGTWTPFCSVGPKEATAACRQLGYTDYDWASVYTDGRFGIPTNYSYFQNVTCGGIENQLKDCNLTEGCTTCGSTIGIRCYNTSVASPTTEPACEPDSLRLVGGTVGKNGRVEVCLNGVWGTICADGWGTSDAFVACKQLGMGYGRPTAITNSTMFGEGAGPVVYSNVLCDGWESQILLCPKNIYGSFQCSNTNAAGVICRDACSDGSIRLTGGDIPSEGTVEICYRSMWGLIVNTGWTDEDASVVCRELGLPFSGAKAVVDSTFGKPSKFVHLSNVGCSGDEARLVNCTARTVTQENSNIVDHVDIAGVMCSSRPAVPTPIPASSTNARPAITTTPEVAPLADVPVEIPLFAVLGVMVVLFIVGLLVITILVFVIVTKRKTATYGNKAQLVGTSINSPENISNPLFADDEGIYDRLEEEK